MQTSKVIRPGYADNFRCIGPACEDSCCAGWQVEIDEKTYNNYQKVKPGSLRVLLDAQVQRGAANAGMGEAFAHIKLLPSLECPFHNAEKLCQIQVELGEGHLSHTCATYPRQSLTIDSLEDKTLTFSCPEACRLLLFDDDLLAHQGANQPFVWKEAKDDDPLVAHFWPIRDFVISLVRNREYALWQRMFLLGTFCRRLEALANSDDKIKLGKGFTTLLKGFSAAVASGGLRAQIETLPSDLALQLGMVMELVKLRRDQTALSPRLRECVDAFSKGIGYGPEATWETMSAAYGRAYEQSYAPYFARHPQILENYLINMIFRTLFPFNVPAGGKSLLHRNWQPEPAKGFALLAMDFALVKGLLIGVAGAHGEQFGDAHVVQTVQSVAKHFEHNKQFVANAYRVLVEKGLDNPHGLTMLLRN